MHYATLHYITLHYITLHHLEREGLVPLRYITLHYITLQYTTLSVKDSFHCGASVLLTTLVRAGCAFEHTNEEDGTFWFIIGPL